MKLSELFEDEERSVLSVMGKQPEVFEGNFYCSNKKLTSLEGCPSVINGRFSCHDNNLTSLEGAPRSLSGTFDFSKNKLESLKYAPISVGGKFYCDYNAIISLEGAPSSVGGNFSCFDNKLTSLHNIHKQIKHIGGWANFDKNPIKSHVLGLLLIEGLTHVYLPNKNIQDIINKYFFGDRDVFACQEELIEAGLDNFAQL